jgi:hypothetical protein
MLRGGQILVLLSERTGADVIDAVRATERISAVFSLPQTHRTLHLKGFDATVEAGAAFRPLLESRLDAFAAQLAPYGFTRDALRAGWYAVSDQELTAIRFTISVASDQTPGPGAGRAIELFR